MMSDRFKGTGVAIVTPFHESGNIDFGALGKIVEHVITGGVSYIVVLGTTGESATLSKETANKRVSIVAGIGGNNTQEVIHTIKNTSFEGIDAILSVCPYYNRPQQKGIYNHFKAIASICPVPVILYNVPGRTSCNMTAETTLKLATDIDNIIGIKEASGNFAQCMDILKNRPQDFLVISGDDALTLPLLSLGADGVISVVANAFPHQFSEMVSLGLKGRFKQARSLHNLMLDYMAALFMDGSPSGVKASMEMMNLCKSNVRLPLVKVNKTVHSLLAEQVESILNNSRPLE
jgi:4-hydroxy-tetrahydrodipicolinate synthase